MERAPRLALVMLLAAGTSVSAVAACSSFGADTSPGAAGAGADAAPEASSGGESGVEGTLADAAADADAAVLPPTCQSAPAGSFCEDFEEAALSANKWRLTQCTAAAGYHCTMSIEDPTAEAPSRHLVMTATDQPSAEIDALVQLAAGVRMVRFAFRMRVVSATASVLAASLQLVAANQTKTYLNFRADGSTWLVTWHDNALVQRGTTNATPLAAGWHAGVMEITLPVGTCSPTNAVAGISVDGLAPIAMPLCVPAAAVSAVVQVGTMVTSTPVPAAVLHFDDLLFTTQ